MKASHILVKTEEEAKAVQDDWQRKALRDLARRNRRMRLPAKAGTLVFYKRQMSRSLKLKRQA